MKAPEIDAGRAIAYKHDSLARKSAVISELPHLTLVIGGARSGKSRHAEGLIAALPPPWIYIATAQAFDDEMHARIAEHRNRRSGDWHTVEAPIALATALDAAGDRPVLVDCLTLWLTNLILGEHDLPMAFAALDAALERREAATVLVSNEVGMGIVPETPLGRLFRDEAGQLNQRIAAQAGHVRFMVAGLAMTAK